MNAVMALKKIGVILDLKDRIAPMEVFRITARFWKTHSGNADNREVIREVEHAVNVLVKLRTEGAEPKHNGMKYL